MLIEQDYKIAWPVVCVATIVGLLVSWGILTGDQFGRVNILYLLLVYLFIPVTSLVVSLVSLLGHNSLNLARLLSLIPIYSDSQKSLLRKLQQRHLDKYWFTLQSQAAAIGFSLASLAVFLVLLLATDMNFVWRSTILEAKDILPLLEGLAFPWQFWEAAQPSLWLLESTQDSRLSTATSANNQYFAWWQYILATQLFYSLFLRSCFFWITRLILARLLKNDLEYRLQRSMQNHPKEQQDVRQEMDSVALLPDAVAVNNWAGAPDEILKLLPQLDLSEDNLLHAGPYATIAAQTIAERWQGQQLVIVKAWEPPLGELEDFLKTGSGFVIPIDWRGSQLLKPQKHHLQEWQRMLEKLPEWQLFLPVELPFITPGDEPMSDSNA